MANRLSQVSGHLTNSHGRGLLTGEVAIITGESKGIGRSTALLFVKEGAKVVVSDIDENRLATVVSEIKAAGGDALGVPGDVGADDFPKKIVDATVQKYGKINHIVNNGQSFCISHLSSVRAQRLIAGFTFDKMLHTMPDDSWDIIMKIHVRAPFRLIRQAAPYFRLKPEARENRSIINISSVSGLHGNVGQANYAAAKAAVVGLTKTIAKEWGPFGVRANTVAFGLIHTRLTAPKEAGATIEIDGKKVVLGVPGASLPTEASPDPEAYTWIPLRRGGTPDDAAGSIFFLASPLASYVSGHTLEVTGGFGI
ncbi:short-chain dehydrogenase/reductase SDR [Tricholoma matsutake]|nr:short-chain dehydrogenase/reductase SDR [Tricholoma matsutake 945]